MHAEGIDISTCIYATRFRRAVAAGLILAKPLFDQKRKLMQIVITGWT